jgi:hypothetical protein
MRSPIRSISVIRGFVISESGVRQRLLYNFFHFLLDISEKYNNFAQIFFI